MRGHVTCAGDGDAGHEGEVGALHDGAGSKEQLDPAFDGDVELNGDDLLLELQHGALVGGEQVDLDLSPVVVEQPHAAHERGQDRVHGGLVVQAPQQG